LCLEVHPFGERSADIVCFVLAYRAGHSGPVFLHLDRSMNPLGTRPHLAVSVAREVRRRFTAAALGMVLLFSGGLAVGLRTFERWRTAAAAQSCFVLLDTRRELPAEQALAKLCATRPDVIAAALTGADGTVRAQWPPDARFGAGVNVGHSEGSTLLDVGGAQTSAWFSARPRETGGACWVVWLEPWPWWQPWAAGSVAMTALIVAFQRRQAHRLCAWIEHGITAPLKRMALPEASTGLESGPVLSASTPWDEINAVGDRLDALRQEVEKARRRIRFLERRGQDQLIASRKHYERRLRRTKAEALIDPLTRLYNRRFLKEELDGIFQQQRDAREELAIVMIDLDNFKGLNDTRGHLAGDTMLRFAADLIRGSIRKSDYAIRYGGDEFVLIMPGTGRTQAGAVVQRIVSLFAQYARRDADDGAVSMSAGIATLTCERAESGSELMCKADAALYRAKGSGKNTVVLSGGWAVT